MNFMQFARHAGLALSFRSSGSYWERRYRAGLTSGLGSYGDLARFKAEILNGFVRSRGVRSVIEFGCGDGNQLGLADYPSYLGLDVSAKAIDLCHARFAGDRTKSFLWHDPRRMVNLQNFVTADLTLSLDVIYHLVEDAAYLSYLDNLFSTARRFVILYSSDGDDASSVAHVRHRRFTIDVERAYPEFRLTDRIENRYPEQSFCSFFFYEKIAG